MAVTVTNAATATALNANTATTNGKCPWVGSYGAVANAVYQPLDLDHRRRHVITCLQLSGTYVTGGFTLTPSAYGLKSIDGIAVICDSGATSGAVAVPALTTAGETPTVKLVVDNAATELTNTTSVANMNFNVILAGY